MSFICCGSAKYSLACLIWPTVSVNGFCFCFSFLNSSFLSCVLFVSVLSPVVFLDVGFLSQLVFCEARRRFFFSRHVSGAIPSWTETNRFVNSSFYEKNTFSKWVVIDINPSYLQFFLRGGIFFKSAQNIIRRGMKKMLLIIQHHLIPSLISPPTKVHWWLLQTM